MAINITGKWDLVSWYKISSQVCILIRRYNVLFPCRIFTGERWSDANAAYINTIFHGLTTQLTPTYPLIHSKTCRAARSFAPGRMRKGLHVLRKVTPPGHGYILHFQSSPEKAWQADTQNAEEFHPWAPELRLITAQFDNFKYQFGFLLVRSFLELGLKIYYMLLLPLAAFACCKAVFEKDTFCHFFLLPGIDFSRDGFAVRFRLLVLLLPSGSGHLTWLSSSLFLQANDFDGRLVSDM